MRVTSEDVILFLSLPQVYKEQMLEDYDRMKRLESSATKTTAVLTGMPGGGGSDRHSLYVNYIEAREKYGKTLFKANKYAIEVSEFLDEIDIRPEFNRLLRLRYMEKLTWKEIAWKLNVSERTAYRYSAEAVNACADYINTKGSNYFKNIFDRGEEDD